MLPTQSFLLTPILDVVRVIGRPVAVWVVTVVILAAVRVG